MTFVFWQNIISIHQSALLRALGGEHNVILVAEKSLIESRQTSGWQVPKFDNLEIVVAPNKNLVDKLLLEHENSHHIFSGIASYYLPTKVLKICKKLKYPNVFVISESYETIGFSGLLRKLKYLVLSIKYRKVIKGIFVTGLPARACFESLYFANDLIVDWGYFTEVGSTSYVKEKLKALPNLLFVGTIDKNKNLLPILPLVHKYRSLYNKFYIVGKGPLVANLESRIENKDDIEYLGVLENSDIQRLMKSCDVLILPSIYDGWGAVVNEALSNGMRVLCSDNCGASILLDGEHRGSVFNIEANNFELHLVKWLKAGVISDAKREGIMEWSKNHISGAVAASYFADCIRFLVKQTETKPKAPWL